MVAVASKSLDLEGKFITRSSSVQYADRVSGIEQDLDDVASHKLRAAKHNYFHFMFLRWILVLS